MSRTGDRNRISCETIAGSSTNFFEAVGSETRIDPAESSMRTFTSIAPAVFTALCSAALAIPAYAADSRSFRAEVLFKLEKPCPATGDGSDANGVAPGGGKDRSPAQRGTGPAIEPGRERPRLG